MGCDIHAVFQKHTPSGWEDVPSKFKENRHYQLFAVLAGVRNGYGFAGVPLGDAVEPIAIPRGLPRDFALVNGDTHRVSKPVFAASWRAEYTKENDDDYGEFWMGDHSHSWLAGEEMLAWYAQAPVVRKCGVISREAYAAWDKKTAPREYSGGISGPGISTVEQPEADSKESTHIRVYWHQRLRDELAYFFDEVARLVGEHGRIRFVFGFDN